MAAKSGKAVLRIGYTNFIMDAKAASDVFQALAANGVELYEDKWVMDKTEPRVTTPDINLITLQLLAEEKYAMGKLLQAAEDKQKGETQ